MRDQDHPRVMTAGKVVLASALGLAAIVSSGAAPADEPFATLRGAVIGEQPVAPHMPKTENKDLRRARNYPEQPPTIPHKIRDYQIDLNTNKCLTCHSRTAIEQSQAPMVSVTHFMDRDGQVRAAVSPRRYFCLQCHVQQSDARPLVGNSFRDVEVVIKGRKGG